MSITTPTTSEKAATRQHASWLVRAAVVVLAAYWLALVTATHVPVPEPLGFQPSDKVVHLLAYGVLAALAGWVWSLLRPFGWRQALMLLAVIAAHGALDEMTQPIVGRNADVRDWYADLLGASLGLGGLLIVQVAVRRWRGIR